MNLKRKSKCERKCESSLVNSFQPSVAFHIEISYLFCSAKTWLVSIGNATLV